MVDRGTNCDFERSRRVQSGLKIPGCVVVFVFDLVGTCLAFFVAQLFDGNCLLFDMQFFAL